MKDYTATQMLFLDRLERLLSLNDASTGLPGRSLSSKLIPLAIHSTLLDCRELNVEHEAWHMLEAKVGKALKKGK